MFIQGLDVTEPEIGTVFNFSNNHFPHLSAAYNLLYVLLIINKYSKNTIVAFLPTSG